jgi:hypothetical protein
MGIEIKGKGFSPGAVMMLTRFLMVNSKMEDIR